MKIHEYNQMMSHLTRPAMAYGGRIGFAAGTPINQEIKNLILKYRVENKFGSEKIVEVLKKNHGINLNQSTVGRELTRLKNAGVPGVDIPRSELATAVEQRIYPPGERKIYKTVREITPNDRVQNPNIPKNAKYKVQLPSGAAKGSTLVTEYFNTEKQAQNAITNVETRFVKQVATRTKPFDDAVKAIHKIALASPDEANSVKNLAKLVYGSANLKNITNISNDLVRYQEFLLGFRDIPGLNTPGADKLDDILSDFPPQNQWGKFASEEIRRSKLRIRDQILKTKGTKLATMRNNILKAVDTGVFNLDEAMGLSATFENAPGYTELGQVIKKKVNTIKGSQIDSPFSNLFKKVIAGTADPKDIAAFNKKSKAFQIKHGVDTPIIEYKPGQKLDVSKFVEHFDKLSPEAQKNVTELAEKGIALKSKAKPMGLMNETVRTLLNNANKPTIMKIRKALGCMSEGGRVGLQGGGNLLDCPMKKFAENPEAVLNKVGQEIPETRTPIMNAFKKLGMGSMKWAGNTFNVGLGPTGVIGINYLLDVDPTKTADRIGLEAEAAFAPTLVKGAKSVTDKIKTPFLRKAAETAAGIRIPGIMNPANALRLARIASPIGLLSLAGEGFYHAHKKEMARRAQLSPEELADFHLERQSRGWSRMKKAGGGMVGIRKPNAIAPTGGPMSQGLRSIMINGKKS